MHLAMLAPFLHAFGHAGPLFLHAFGHAGPPFVRSFGHDGPPFHMRLAALAPLSSMRSATLAPFSHAFGLAGPPFYMCSATLATFLHAWAYADTLFLLAFGHTGPPCVHILRLRHSGRPCFRSHYSPCTPQSPLKPTCATCLFLSSPLADSLLSPMSRLLKGGFVVLPGPPRSPFSRYSRWLYAPRSPSESCSRLPPRHQQLLPTALRRNPRPNLQQPNFPFLPTFSRRNQAY